MTAMRFVDTHTHIYVDDFDADREAVITRARDAGVELMLFPNIDVASIAPMMLAYRQHPDFFRVIMGLHPTEVNDTFHEALKRIEKELENPCYIGVGEIGLDFYWDQTYKRQQIEAFELQLDWAKQLHLPVSIHTRDAFDTLLPILERKQDGALSGVLHCFTGTEVQALQAIALGFYLGIGGTVTYKSCPVRDFLPQLPSDRLLLETDAPYLPPVPHRGQRNEPAFVADTARFLAQVLQTDIETIGETTMRNAMTLFRL